MSVEENNAIVQRLFDEFFNAKKVKVVDELLAPGFDGLKAPGQTEGGSDRETFKQLARMGFKAIRDWRVTVHDLIAEDDKVVATLTLRGTHEGPYFGLPPTGRRTEEPAIDIYRIADGKIAEAWSLVDALTLFNQIGLGPSFEELARVDEWKPE